MLDGLVAVRSAESGVHLLGWLPGGVDHRAASEAARRHGIEAPPLPAYRVRGRREGGLVLGSAAFSPRELAGGVERLAAALRPVARTRA